jgi:hypothetical protein
MMSSRTKILLPLLCNLVLVAVPAFADFKLERRLSLDPGGTFTLQSDVGRITLVGDSTSGAQVTVTSRRDDLDDRYDFRFEERPGQVTVTVRRRGSWLRSWLNNGWLDNTHFAIHVPSKAVVNLSTSGGSIDLSRVAGRAGVRTSGGSLRVEQVDGPVDGHTSGGSISMRSVRGDVNVHTSGGSITVTDVQGTLRATTSGGSIDIDRVSNDVHAETSGGHVEVRGAGGRVEAHTSGGSVTVRFGPGNDRGGDVSTSGGTVRAEIDPTVRLSIDASSSGGGVSSELPVTIQGRISNRSLRGDLNGGGASLRLRSSGGGVRLLSASRVAGR